MKSCPSAWSSEPEGLQNEHYIMIKKASVLDGRPLENRLLPRQQRNRGLIAGRCKRFLSSPQPT